MIVTIDGPAAAGKSTAARALAQRLGFEFLDTGALYRAVTLACQRAGVSPSDEPALRELLSSVRLEVAQGRVLLNGDDVSGLIRTAEITRLSRAAADSRLVREFLNRVQRHIAQVAQVGQGGQPVSQGSNIVTEGRDQGTVVFPNAECKFFLIAQPEERARRRHREMTVRGERVSFEQVLQAQNARDQTDEERLLAPMKPAAAAIIVDSTELTLDQVVELLEKHVRDRLRQAES